MSDPKARLIRALLDEWKSHGWVDVDNSALKIADLLADGKPSIQAAGVASRAFLDKNNAVRTEVLRAVTKIAESVDPSTRPKAVAVVLTAIVPEYRAVRSQLSEVRERVTGHGTRFEVGRVTGGHLDWDVAVAQIGPGNTGAAAEAFAAITEFRADVVLFVGIAGGLRTDLADGTVVVADRVYHYERGRAEEQAWRARPVSFPTRHRLTQLAIALGRNWSRASVLVSPIAAGEALVASSRSEVAQIVFEYFNDAIAIDMESAGVYDAAHRAGVPALAVRGISDRLDDKGSGTDPSRQTVAAKNAAEFAIALLRAIDLAVVSRMEVTNR